VASEAGPRQILVTESDELLVIGSLRAIGEQFTNFVEPQIVESITVHLVERARIPEVEHLSRRSKLSQVGHDWILQLKPRVAERDADSGSTGGFNQISGLVAGGCKIHMPNILVENSA
jgi:hypothetical protein